MSVPASLWSIGAPESTAMSVRKEYRATDDYFDVNTVDQGFVVVDLL